MKELDLLKRDSIILQAKNGITVTVRKNDAIMDNGERVSFISGKYVVNNQPQPDDIVIPQKEWDRVKIYFRQTSYEGYFKRKPLMKGILIFILN